MEDWVSFAILPVVLRSGTNRKYITMLGKQDRVVISEQESVEPRGLLFWKVWIVSKVARCLGASFFLEIDAGSPAPGLTPVVPQSVSAASLLASKRTNGVGLVRSSEVISRL